MVCPRGKASAVNNRELPWEYFASSSDTSLESFMLARLNDAANLRKSIEKQIVEWAEAQADAELVGQLLRNRERLARIADLRQGILPFAAPEKSEGGKRLVAAEPAARRRRNYC